MRLYTAKASLIFTLATIISISSFSVNASWADDEWAKSKVALKKAAKQCSVTHESYKKENQELFDVAEFGYKRLKNKNDEGLNSLIDRLCAENRMEKQKFVPVSRDNDYLLMPQDSVCFLSQEIILKNHRAFFTGTDVFTDHTKSIQACKDFYSKKYFGKTWKIQNDFDKKMKTEKKKEKARKASIAESKKVQLAEIVTALNIPEDQLITWKEGLVKKYINNPSGDVKRHINAMNKDMRDWSNPNSKVAVFNKPSKGEFEKTADYEKRVIEAREKHDAENRKRMDDVRAKSSGIREKAFNTYFGVPSTSSVKYDADTEVFTLNVKSNAFDYKISGSYEAPIADAEQTKNYLVNAIPTVIFLMGEEHMEPKGVVLDFPDKLVTLVNISQGSQPILIGDDVLERWHSTLTKEKSERNKQYAAETEEKRRAIEARNKMYGHNGKYLKEGALVCVNLKDMYTLMTIRRIGSMAAEPAGCMVSNSGLDPISDRSAGQGGVTKVWLKNTGTAIYTRTEDIID